MARQLTAPKDPESLAGVLAIVRILAGERGPETESEKAIVASLGGGRGDSARRMVAAVDGAPEAERTALLGSAAAPDYRIAVPASPGGPVTGNAGHHSGTNAGERLPTNGGRSVGEPDTPPPVFTIRYRGLFCREETNWDGGSNSDEVYVLTNAITIAADGTNVIRAERHPVGSPSHYQDVDAGEERVGPVAALWQGPTNPVSLSVVVMEHDYGDPDKYKEDVRSLVDIVVAYLKYKYSSIPWEKVAGVVTDAINWVLGTGDDVIETQYVVLTRPQMDEMTKHAPGFYYDLGDGSNRPTTIPYHFKTEHRGSGATYIACFDLVRDPSNEEVTPIP